MGWVSQRPIEDGDSIIVSDDRGWKRITETDGGSLTVPLSWASIDEYVKWLRDVAFPFMEFEDDGTRDEMLQTLERMGKVT